MHYAKKNHTRMYQEGQALITLIFFALIATIYISAAVIVLAVNIQGATRTQRGYAASRLAEGALEDTLLRLLRDPNYAGGTFNLGDGTVTVNVVGDTSIKSINIVYQDDYYYRSFQSYAEFNETEMTVTRWQESF